MSYFQFPLLGSPLQLLNASYIGSALSIPFVGFEETKIIKMLIRNSFNSLCWVHIRTISTDPMDTQYFQFPLLGSISKTKYLQLQADYLSIPFVGFEEIKGEEKIKSEAPLSIPFVGFG